MAKKRKVQKKKRMRRLGCLLILALAVLLAVALFLLLRPRTEADKDAAEATAPLWDGGWYADCLGRIDGRKDEKALERGMKAYTKKTGVRPYLALVEGVEPQALEDFARQQYEALFSDGDHLLVVYDEWGQGEYYLTGQTGPDSALSEGDVTALLSCLEAAYGDEANGSYAQAFGAGFAQGARQATRPAATRGPGLLLALGLVLAVLSAVLILILRRRARYGSDEGEMDD